MRKVIVKFIAFNMGEDKYVSDLYFSSWPKNITSLRCGFPEDPKIYTFGELSKELKGVKLRKIFHFDLINNDSEQRETIGIKFGNCFPKSLGSLKPGWCKCEISETMKKLGY